MEEKITSVEDYKNALVKKKEYRDLMFNLRLEIVMKKKEPEVVKLLEEKVRVVKVQMGQLAVKIKEYEVENNIEVKKEGKKK